MDTEYIFEYDGGPEMKKTIFIAGMVIVIMLSIISWFVLPETVSVQVGLDGEISNTMPKLFAILIPAVMSVIGGIIGIKSNDSNRKKGTALLCIGIAIMLFTLFFNFNR